MKHYYSDAAVTIYHGDAREFVPEFESGLVEPCFLVTDPPYGIAWSRGLNRSRASAAHPGIQGDESTEARDALLADWDGRPAVVFGSLHAPPPLEHLTQTLIWHKPADAGVVGSITGFRRDVEAIYLCGDFPRRTVQWSSVLRGSSRDRNGHPHSKPIDLMARLIDLAPGTVLDPFMGSGTTLRAAKDLGRKAIGIEIEERYCEIAAKRCAQEVLDLGVAA